MEQQGLLPEVTETFIAPCCWLPRNEQRVHRAFGGLAIALGNIREALGWALSQPLNVKNLERKHTIADNDVELIEKIGWV